MNTFVKATLLACLGFTCLATAQQQVVTQAGDANQCNSSYSDSKPKPAVETYLVQKDNQTCLVMQFAGYLSIDGGKFIDIKNGKVNMTNSVCGSKNANSTSDPKIVIEFDCGSLSFTVGSNDSRVFIKSIDGIYQEPGKNASESYTNTTENGLFSTTQTGHYYKCNAEQGVKTNKPNVTLYLSNFAYEAYRSAVGSDFYQIPEECALDSGPVSDLVLVGVGICLIVLVAIVLVAYFIGRRRWAERSSYESV